jgi:hypothetical protein
MTTGRSLQESTLYSKPCRNCGRLITIDYEIRSSSGGPRILDAETERPHICQGRVYLFDHSLGFAVRKSEVTIAFNITAEAIRLGINPYRVRTKRAGDYLVVY